MNINGKLLSQEFDKIDRVLDLIKNNEYWQSEFMNEIDELRDSKRYSWAYEEAFSKVKGMKNYDLSNNFTSDEATKLLLTFQRITFSALKQG